MYLDRETFVDNLIGLVGMHQTDNPEYPTLSDALITSRSDRWVQDVKAGLLTIENLDQTAKNFERFNYDTYAGGTEYSKWERVAYLGVNYLYINATPSTGNTPPNATYWQVITNLSDMLTRTYRQAVLDVLDDWEDRKKVKEKVRAVFDNVLLYDGVANFRDVETNGDKFVGLRVRIKDSRSLICLVKKIGTQFNAALTGSLPIYVYHSSDHRNLVATINITHGVADKHIWTAPSSTLALRYSDTNLIGGEYYIGYKQSELDAVGGQALRMDLNWEKGPCGSCNSRWKSYHKNYSPYLDIVGFEMPESQMPSTEDFSPDIVPINYTSNFGLNLDLSVECDLAAYMLQEEKILARPIQFMWAKKLLEQMANNTRTENAIANNVREMARREVYELREAKGTVADQLEKVLKSLDFDLSGLDKVCLPCDPKGFNQILGVGSLR